MNHFLFFHIPQDNSDRQKNIDILLSISSFALFFLFYLFFTFFDKAVICVDSPSYISMSFVREPIYPLFLAFCRLFPFAGENQYLFLVVFLQGILAAFSGWLLSDKLRKYFSLSLIGSIPIYSMPLLVSLLCRFAAKRSAMYTNSILTEGITMSFFYLFVLFLFFYITKKEKRYYFFCVFLSVLMILTRKQMLFAFLLFIVFMFYDFFIKEKAYKNGVVLICFTFIVIFLSVFLLDCSYNYLLRGEFKRHSSDNRFFTTMVFYNAEREDANYIPDSTVKELFYQIYDSCEEQGFLGHSAEKGWLNEVSHFGDHYDHIQIDTMWPMILEQAKINLGEESTVAERDMEADRMNTMIILSVLPHQLPKHLHCLVNNFLSGLITTVAQRNRILTVYSALIYCLYLFLMIHLYIKTSVAKRITGGKMQQIYQSILLFSMITTIAILLNVGLVSAVIFCQTRYTIYNMALFYISLLLLIYGNFHCCFRN